MELKTNNIDGNENGKLSKSKSPSTPELSGNKKSLTKTVSIILY